MEKGGAARKRSLRITKWVHGSRGTSFGTEALLTSNRIFSVVHHAGQPQLLLLHAKLVRREVRDERACESWLSPQKIWTLGTDNRMARRGIAVVAAFRDRPSTADRWLGLLSSLMSFPITGKAISTASMHHLQPGNSGNTWF